MCSQCSQGVMSPAVESRIPEQWNCSDYETDSEESAKTVKMVRSRSAAKTVTMVRNRSAPPTQLRRKLRVIPVIEKGKTDRGTEGSRGFSLENRMKEWHRSSVVNRKAECAAKQYTEMIQDDTLRHLSHSVRVAGSIAGKGSDINVELRRQELVLRKADVDISFAEYETDQTTETLKGMKSLRSKFSRSIRKKEPKLKAQLFNDIDLLNGEMGLNALSRKCSPRPVSEYGGSPKDIKQKQIKTGMEELNGVLDVIKAQQIDAAWTLNRHGKHLTVFENKLGSTHKKINEQSQVISNIITDS